IATYEDKLHAAITVNPHALAEADARDRERAQGKIRGPLHGIPVALKDNIHTTEMRTTGGALAFEDLVPPYEATITKNLKNDGAIMLGVLEGATPDPNDPATRTCTPPPGRDYEKFLNRDGLKGARIGIPRAFYYDKVTPPGDSSTGSARGEPRASATGSGRPD